MMNRFIQFRGEENSGKTTTLRNLILDLERDIKGDKDSGKIIPLNADAISQKVREDLIAKGKVLLFCGSNDETRNSKKDQDWCAIIIVKGRVVVVSTGGDDWLNYFDLFWDLLIYLTSLQELKDFVIIGVLAVTDSIFKETVGHNGNECTVPCKIYEIRNLLKKIQDAFFAGQAPLVLKSTKIHSKRGPISTRDRELIEKQCANDVKALRDIIFQDELLASE